ncbi:MAG: oligoendopeptidase F [Candidatus Neomarinimicrobiota bacterium]
MNNYSYYKILIPAVSLLLISEVIGQESGAVPTREEVDVNFTWDVSSLFVSDAAWDEAFMAAEKMENEFSKYEDNLGKNGLTLLECLQLNDEAGMLLDRLWSYAARKADVDLGNTENQARRQKIRGLYTKLSKATAFIDPEILTISPRKLNKYLKKHAGLKVYKHYFDELSRVQDHVLSKKEEKLLALAGRVTSGASTTYGILTNTDFKWGNIEDEDSNSVEMSGRRYYRYTSSSDRRVRHDAYMEVYVPYNNHLKTLTSLIATQLNTNIFYMQARNYETTLERALDGPDIPTYVYHNLIDGVNNNLAPLQRWAEMKKRVLMVDELRPYDTYAPLFPSVDKQYTYEEAQVLIKEAFAPLGAEILEIVDRAFKERWIDVYENAGKSGGAYSAGVYGVHPYILMNFDGTLNSVLTLAHELGHTIHSYLTNAAQPYIYSDYATFNAEVASTINEALLRDYLLERVETDEEKLSLLQQYIQDIGSTFYRQTRFAEFELAIYKMAENDEPLTSDSFSELFGEIYSKYWGPAMVIGHEEKLSWSRIPHFYYNYYVYAYATSFAASQMLAQDIKEQGQPAVDRLIKFLSSGGSDAPLELLKSAGADLSTPAPFEATAKKMDDLLDQMEEILAKKG